MGSMGSHTSTEQIIAISCSELILGRGQTDKDNASLPSSQESLFQISQSYGSVITCLHIILKKNGINK